MIGRPIDIHELLKNQREDEHKIVNFYDRIRRVKEKAKLWLSGLEKNDKQHSKRLEDYLNRLIPSDKVNTDPDNQIDNTRLKLAECYILLYAVYLHDIGYRDIDGKINPDDHPFRTYQYIQIDPSKYLFTGPSKHEWEAVAEVCQGHASEELIHLNDIKQELADACLCRNGTINLRWITALLRLADEIDDTYIRVNAGYRKHVDLVKITEEMITFHFDAENAEWRDCLKIISRKRELLKSSLEYLRQKGMTKGLYIHPEGPEQERERNGQGIQCLLPIEDALAAQPDEDRWRPLFWPDLEKLYKRRECDQILQRLNDSNVVLLEGYSASGKSSLICHLAHDLVSEKKGVYYGNLTTRVGLKCTPQELPFRLLDEAKRVRQKIFVIIEDIHHSLNEFDRLNPLAANPHIKLLLTSRPLKIYQIQEDLSKKLEKEMMLFQWISSENRMALKTDETVVKEILTHRGFCIENLESVLNIVGKKEPNLMLLSFVMQASKKKHKNADKIKKEDVLDYVRDHLTELRERVCSTTSDQTYYWKLIATLSLFSEFEVPVEQDFLLKVPPENFLLTQILQQLEKEKEIVSFTKFKPQYKKYYLIPHSQLASLYRDVLTDASKRLDIAEQYLLHGEFFGTLTRRLYFEDQKILNDLVRNCGKKLVGKDLSEASLKEIGYFLWGIRGAEKELAREIASTHAQTLKSKLSEASLKEMTDFFLEFFPVDRALAQEIASVHAQTLNTKLSEASLEGIGEFLKGFRYVDIEVAREIASTHAQTLKSKLSEASLEGIGEFLKGIRGAEKELGCRPTLAREIASTYAQTLKSKLSEASVSEIGWFLGGIGMADKKLAREIASTHAQTLKVKDLSLASLKEIRYFLQGIRIVGDRELYHEIASVHAQTLKAKDLSEAKFEEIGDFLEEISYADEKLAQEIASAHTQTLKAKDLSNASLEEIREFLKGIAEVDKELAQEIASVHAQTLNTKLAEESLEEIWYFLWGIGEADKELAQEIVSAHAQTLKVKDLSLASLKEIGYFLWGIGEVDKELAQEIACAHVQTLKAKDLSEAKLEEIGCFLGGIAEADRELAQEIASVHAQTLKAKFTEASPEERRDLLEVISIFSKDLVREMDR